MADLAFASAAELARLIAGKQVSPVEVVRSQLERITSLDGSLKSFITVTAEAAMTAAREAEAAVLAGRPLGPLHGVPLGLKDLYDTAGVRTTGGSRILADRVPKPKSGAVIYVPTKRIQEQPPNTIGYITAFASVLTALVTVIVVARQ